MKDSKIAWTDHTFNPWIGCTRVSPGCVHCYAESLNHRWGKNNWGEQAERSRTSFSYWRQPFAWNKAAEKAKKKARVFCASMADVGEDRSDLIAARFDLATMIVETPWLDWLLLTKRPENLTRLFAPNWGKLWPSNVWAGTSVENQAMADKRIESLFRVPARIRFLSCEPLIGQVRLDRAILGLNWIIVGGESGAGCRPMELEWARDLLYQSRQVKGLAFFMKQLGGVHDKRHELSDFPEDLRIQEWPDSN